MAEDKKMERDERYKNSRGDIRRKRTQGGYKMSQRSVSLIMQRRNRREKAAENTSEELTKVTGSSGNLRQATVLQLDSTSSIEVYEQDMMMRCGISETAESDHERINLSVKEEAVSVENTSYHERRYGEDICKDLNGRFAALEDTMGEAVTDLTWTYVTDCDTGPPEDASRADVDDDCRHHLKNQVSERSFEHLKNDKISGEDLRYLQNQSSDEIVRTFILFFDKFVDICSRDNTPFEETSLLLAVLARGCKTKRCGESLLKILSEVKDSKFMKTVIPSMLGDIPPMKMEADTKATLLNILILIRYISTLFPSSITLVFGLDNVLQRSMSVVIPDARTQDKEFIKEMKIFSDIKATMMERFEKEKQKAQKPKRKIKPPDDFRLLPVFPILEDINTNGMPFLKKNKKIGGYEDIDEYLDTQFRLLREDFIQPLREGIQEYLEYQKNPRIRKSIRVYHNVAILASKWSNEKILHTLQFDVSKLQRVNWEYSKRFIYGTLLCLSSDSFQTFYLATVAQSERNGLQAGYLTVEFQLDYDEVDALIQKELFVMLETPAYFEAYKHVLEALQTIDDDMPFAKYIVDCETDCRPPLYLRHSSLNFTSVLGTKKHSPKRESELIYKRKLLPIDSCAHNGHSNASDTYSESLNSSDSFTETEIDAAKECTQHWPKPGELSLNEGQYKAFKDALSKEFCIIQGPPGTGKTYLGLKIVQVLLSNLGLWHNIGDGTTGKKCPILLVCYTNHALDQFMEGILRFVDKDDCNSIVRIGGRSQTEAINKLSLKNRRFDLKRNIPDLHGNRICISHQLETCHFQIRQCGWQILELSKGIAHEDVLRPFMGHHFDVLSGRFEDRRSNPAILKWLGFHNLIRCSKIRVNKYFQIDSSSAGDYFTKNADLMESKEKFLALSLEEIEREYEEDAPKAKGTKEQNLRQLSKKAREELFTKLNYNLQIDSKMVEAEAVRVKYIWNLKNTERWRLYRFWLDKLHEYLTKKRQDDLKQNLRMFNEKVKEYEAASREIDCHILQKAKVIGMTTTGAAKNRELLKTIGPRIVIIEEAAAVLESHTVTSIYPGCEHLILIGDHQQLRPNPSVYRLAKRYNLDISLFERMANNGHKTNTLTLQHRMRPCISRLMRHIYLKLEDHPSVDMYVDIKGVGKNLFFINHSEKERDGEDSLSHANDFEASYLARLCKYLLFQGYKQSEITILSTYLAQVSCIRKLLPKPEYNDLLVTAVDNFQGEENDIILLSLVRSNEEEKVGFLKTENRICVALSRAKMGMYVIGNFEVLAKKSDLWRRIVKDVKENNEFGSGLPLYCQNHKYDEEIFAVKAQDFNKAPAGGCLKMCDFRLDCGHVCGISCHPFDKDHKEYKCEKACLKTCQRGHPCRDLCHQICSDCKTVIPKTLPACHHEQDGFCYIKPEDEKCQHLCERKCSNGHLCGKLCHKKCGKCRVQVSKTMPKCGHSQTVACYGEPNDIKCLNPCERKCSRGHTCKKTCSQPCGKCNEKVSKSLPKCGHSQLVDCYLDPKEIICQNPCKKTCSEGHKCENTCSQICGRCMTKVKKIVPRCGHVETVYCYFEPNYIMCRHQCEKTCPDGHPCHQKCHEKCAPCSVEVKKVLPKCGHEQTVKCSDILTNVKCFRQCENVLSCGHKCNHTCGQTCRCNIVSIKTLKCGHEGNIFCENSHQEEPDCTVKCQTTLKCGHLCEGSCRECLGGRLHRKCSETHTCQLLCGHEGVIKGTYTEPCTEMYGCSYGSCKHLCGEACTDWTVGQCSCRCHTEEFSDTFIGKTLDHSAGNVTLLDCDHIVEASSLHPLMTGTINKHGVKIVGHRRCPFCSIPIRNSPRYGRIIKEIERDVHIIYQQCEIGQNMIQEINRSIQEKRGQFRNQNVWRKFSKIGRSVPSLLSAELQLALMKDLKEIEAKSQSVNSSSHENDQIGAIRSDIANLWYWFMEGRDLRLETFSDQELTDATNELKRLKLMVFLRRVNHEVKQVTVEEMDQIKRQLALQRARRERYHTKYTNCGTKLYLNLSTGAQKEVDILEAKLKQLVDDCKDQEHDHLTQPLTDAQKRDVMWCIELLQRPGPPSPKEYENIQEVIRGLPVQMDTTFSSSPEVTTVPKPLIYGCWFKCREGHIFHEGKPYNIPNPDDVKCQECMKG